MCYRGETDLPGGEKPMTREVEETEIKEGSNEKQRMKDGKKRTITFYDVSKKSALYLLLSFFFVKNTW